MPELNQNDSGNKSEIRKQGELGLEPKLP